MPAWRDQVKGAQEMHEGREGGREAGIAAGRETEKEDTTGMGTALTMT